MSKKSIDELQVKITGDASQYKKVLKDAASETKKATSDIDRNSKKTKDPFAGVSINPFSKKLDQMRQRIRAAVQDVRSGALKDDITAGARQSVEKFNQKIRQIGANIRGMNIGKSLQFGMGARQYTQEFLAVEERIRNANQEMERLALAEQRLEASRPTQQGAEFDMWTQSMAALEQRTVEVGRELDRLNGRRGLMQAMGADTERVHGPFNRLKTAINGVTAQVPGLRQLRSAVGSIAGGVRRTISAFQKLGSAIRKASGFIGSMLSRAKNGIPILRNLGKSGHSSGNMLGLSFKKVLMYGFGIRSLFRLINRLRNTLKEGFADMAEQMPTSELAGKINQLKSAFNGLKGSFSAAFAPILSYVAPALTTLINMCSKALQAVGALMAALTGKQFVVASAGASGYSSAASGAADSANKAAKANEKLKRSVLGFDQLNKLDDNSDNSDGSGGGGGGGGGGGITYTDAEVPEGIKKLAEKIKEAWKNADFTEIGRIVGEKLRDALEKIPWDKIKTTVNKIAKSIATFLNGFLETPGLFDAVGKTMAEALNTVFGGLNTFATNFHWKSLGKAISTSINSFFKNWDAALTGKTFSNMTKGILDTMITAVEKTDWAAVGKKCATMIKNIDWGGIVKKAFRLAGAALGGVAAFLGGLLSDAFKAIPKYFKKKIEECGGSVVKGIFKGIKDAIIGVGKWIKTHIFDPFIKGFKNAFGISSPAKTMVQPGKDIIQGLWDGMKKKWKSVVNWVKKLPGTLKQSAGLIGDGLKSIFVDEGDGGVDSKKYRMHSGIVNRGRGRNALGTTSTHTVEINLKKKPGQTVKKLVGDRTDVTVNRKKGWKDSLAKWMGNKVTATVNRTKGWVSETLMKFLELGDGTADAKVNRTKGSGFVDTLKKFLGIGDDGVDAKVNRTPGWTDTIKQFLGIDTEQSAKVDRTKGWTDTIKKFLGIDTDQSVKVNRTKGWKDTLASFLGGSKHTVKIMRKKGWSTSLGALLGGWKHTVKIYRSKGWSTSLSSFIGSAVTVAVKITKGWLGSGLNIIKGWLGLGKAEGGVFTHGSWKPITAYAGGGSPGGGQLFVAREAGPELVGTLGGSTAVMNNKQIVSSVAAGVASAVQDVLVPALMSQGDGPSGDIVLFLGDEEVARSSLRGIKKIDKQQHPVIQLQGV